MENNKFVPNNSRFIVEVGYLKKLVEGLKSLDEKSFKYDSFISKFDDSTGCGTVCCAFGWMPRFVPEAGVMWSSVVQDGAILKDILIMSHLPNDVFTDYRIRIYNDFMFYGAYIADPTPDYSNKFGKPADGDNISRISLKQVIRRIEYVIKRMERHVPDSVA